MQIECPHCQTLLEVSEPADEQITCPTCGGEISLTPGEPEMTAGEHLDSLRIRQLSASQRAANRIRSYCIIATMFCVVAAAQLAWGSWHAESRVRSCVHAALGVLSALGAIYFMRVARR